MSALPPKADIHVVIGSFRIRLFDCCDWQVGRPVEDRTSLHSRSPQNGNLLSTDQRLLAKISNFESNSRTPETGRRAKSRARAGLSDACASQNRETGLGGWGARIRTWEWRNQNPLPYHLATPQKVPESRLEAISRAAAGPYRREPARSMSAPLIYTYVAKRALTGLRPQLD